MDPIAYRINPDLAWRTIDGEVVILKIKSTTYYSLDPVGSAIWTSLDGVTLTREEILRKVLDEFEVEAETAEKDLAELLEDLLREELLVAA